MNHKPQNDIVMSFKLPNRIFEAIKILMHCNWDEKISWQKEPVHCTWKFLNGFFSSSQFKRFGGWCCLFILSSKKTSLKKNTKLTKLRTINSNAIVICNIPNCVD